MRRTATASGPSTAPSRRLGECALAALYLAFVLVAAFGHRMALPGAAFPAAPSAASVSPAVAGLPDAAADLLCLNLPAADRSGPAAPRAEPNLCPACLLAQGLTAPPPGDVALPSRPHIAAREPMPSAAPRLGRGATALPPPARGPPVA